MTNCSLSISHLQQSVFVLFVRQLRDAARGKMDTVLAVENSNDISLNKEMLSNMKH